ncbi:Mor transcription activator family protein [Massilia sp. YIM B02443]|uniref:Mor transcription activator family protein n=1 Tax=Massilia sp. YIM B02443 TaxID=3050127 RepID=UPI0025B6F928|nr:Mor transcription activator family protein [Massilia sp. YIM B02443]
MTTVLLDDPDLIDSIFAFIAIEFPELKERAGELKQMARREFAGIETYIPRRPRAERDRIVQEVMRLFDGRNATEVARRLNISRASVYRIIKTPGGKK